MGEGGREKKKEGRGGKGKKRGRGEERKGRRKGYLSEGSLTDIDLEHNSLEKVSQFV